MFYLIFECIDDIVLPKRSSTINKLTRMTRADAWRNCSWPKTQDHLVQFKQSEGCTAVDGSSAGAGDHMYRALYSLPEPSKVNKQANKWRFYIE